MRVPQADQLPNRSPRRVQGQGLRVPPELFEDFVTVEALFGGPLKQDPTTYWRLMGRYKWGYNGYK